ncbi:hypothetical protein ACRAWF_40485 [Streptomyces sp. L7]
MSHTLGATFHLAHGRTNAVLLPHVIRYNGTVPTKLTRLAQVRELPRPATLPGHRPHPRHRPPPPPTPRGSSRSPTDAVERLRTPAVAHRRAHVPGLRRRRRGARFSSTHCAQRALNAYEDRVRTPPALEDARMLDDMQHRHAERPMCGDDADHQDPLNAGLQPAGRTCARSP